MTDKTKQQAPRTAEILAKQRADLDFQTLKDLQLAAAWRWHYGNVTGLGFFSTAGGREVVIQWDEGGASRKQGGISDEQWEVFKLAFEGTGRIAVLSDEPDTGWKFDYRFLEAQR
ncbi:MAG: hypothetical protein QNJ46_20325 [Leptolyngbyaceae cyanobacterium MO_188.B28]|nr:hypothetical protein [Leptolyngbyaceae cyanobacterium MO_188.B28]